MWHFQVSSRCSSESVGVRACEFTDSGFDARKAGQHLFRQILGRPIQDGELSAEEKAEWCARFRAEPLQEGLSLFGERDPGMFYSGLMILGLRQEKQGHDELAAAIYRALAFSPAFN